MNTVLTIAGSDSSGGAGVQADIKTMTAHGVFGMSALTALTAQNTMGVRKIAEVEPEFLREELRAVFDDIFPDAVKIGMVSSKGLIEVIADELSRYKAKHIVVDPVMVSTSGSVLMQDDAKEALTKRLFPLAEVITPNLAELGVLTGEKITDMEGMTRAGRNLSAKYKIAVLAKGGHLTETAADILIAPDGEITTYAAKRIDNPNTHGTGCTLSSAIASNLAKGKPLKEAVKLAKDYMFGAIKANLNLGQGRGPLNHMYRGIVAE